MIGGFAARARKWGPFAGFAAAGLATSYGGFATLAPLVMAIRDRAPLIAFAARGVVGLPIGISLFALAAMTLCTRPPSTPGGRRQARNADGASRIDWAAVWLAIAVIGIALALLTAPTAELAFGYILTDAGYSACPRALALRDSPPKWWRVNSVSALKSCEDDVRD